MSDDSVQVKTPVGTVSLAGVHTVTFGMLALAVLLLIGITWRGFDRLEAVFGSAASSMQQTTERRDRESRELAQQQREILANQTEILRTLRALTAALEQHVGEDRTRRR